MTLMNDKSITRNVIEKNMITPFVTDKHASGVLSYGLSSYGYDARASDEFKIFSTPGDTDDFTVVDPKNFSDKISTTVMGDYCIIPPNGFALATTVEYFRIPRNVFVLCLGKSTYARCGIIVNVTPLEPGWEGNVTLEFSNTTPLPAKIYSNEGACQFIFFESEDGCNFSYDQLKGKYMKQTGITGPKINV